MRQKFHKYWVLFSIPVLPRQALFGCLDQEFKPLYSGLSKCLRYNQTSNRKCCLQIFPIESSEHSTSNNGEGHVQGSCETMHHRQCGRGACVPHCCYTSRLFAFFECVLDEHLHAFNSRGPRVQRILPR